MMGLLLYHPIMDKIRQRFEAGYVKDETTGCWNWIKSVDTHGYGLFFSVTAKFRQAHKWAWVLYVGAIPDGAHTLHRCDNRRCVNPAHLFLGDQSANMADRQAKGRQSKGMPPKTMTRHSKLTPELALAIRADSRPYAVIAQEFGVSVGAVNKIKSRERWWWV